MEVLRYIKEGKENAITRHELMILTGCPDRAIRAEIERLRRTYAIINNQDAQGYYLASSLEEAERFKRQEEARAKTIFYRLKGTKDYIKKAATDNPTAAK